MQKFQTKMFYSVTGYGKQNPFECNEIPQN